MQYRDKMNKIIIDIEETNKTEEYRHYELIKRLYMYRTLLLKSQSKESEKMLSMIEKCLKKEDDVLRTMLKEDIDELFRCFRSGAYKATLIMAGSILEAFLLDWLSEKDGVDYFKTPYSVKRISKNGVEYEKEDDRLVTYIRAIRELEMPAWMEPSRKADNIRSQRNLVHVKLCLKDNVKIDKETCETVISDLKYIISTRIQM